VICNFVDFSSVADCIDFSSVFGVKSRETYGECGEVETLDGWASDAWASLI
jgi:hypothetical protein